MLFRLLVFVVSTLPVLCGCSSGKKSAGTSPKIEVLPNDIKVDSTDYFNRNYSVTRIVEPKDLEGKWNVITMYRQHNLVTENLTGVTLSFADSSFGGNAPCNSIAGDFIIKGISIRFLNIMSTKMACDKLEQETVFLQLLENMVRIVSIDANRLLLKDKTGNNVFACVREK